MLFRVVTLQEREPLLQSQVSSASNLFFSFNIIHYLAPPIFQSTLSSFPETAKEERSRGRIFLHRDSAFRLKISLSFSSTFSFWSHFPLHGKTTNFLCLSSCHTSWLHLWYPLLVFFSTTLPAAAPIASQ